MEYGETYTFVQGDRTNYWHPLDFSYFPDAHHVGADLLDPRVDGNVGLVAATGPGATAATASLAAPADSCASNMTCPSPMYLLNDGYLGTYSNIDDVAPVTTQQHEFGLLLYEDFFFKSMPQWKGLGTFSIKLKFDDESFRKDIFYYCRIHQFMAGRIKLLKNGVPVNPNDEPATYYEQEVPGEFDQRCGVSTVPNTWFFWWVVFVYIYFSHGHCPNVSCCFGILLLLDLRIGSVPIAPSGMSQPIRVRCGRFHARICLVY